MVKHRVRQTYTYYTPEESTGRVVEGAPLAGRGKAWTLGAYTHPVYPSPLNVRVGDAGIEVWTVIGWLHALDGDKERFLGRYGQILRPEDLDVAIWFYQQNEQSIEERLAEEVGAA